MQQTSKNKTLFDEIWFSEDWWINIIFGGGGWVIVGKGSGRLARAFGKKCIILSLQSYFCQTKFVKVVRYKSMKVKGKSIFIRLLRKDIERGGIYLPLRPVGLKKVETVSTLKKFFQIHSLKKCSLTVH